jgi:hypothetical protein
MLINEIIRKTASGYRLYSKKGKNLGTYDSKIGAEKREKQVNYFKHMNEGYKLQLERADDMYILHITDSDTGKRTEVRGKSGYESGNYDADDKLHQLLDRIGKTANVSELINGEVVTINPKHPDAERAKKATDVAFNEETGAEMLKIFRNMHHDTARNKEMDAFIKAHEWELRDFTPVTATTEGVAREPHAAGLAKTALTAPANTVVINTPGELDWYKLGEYIATLQDLDPHEYGQSESDMMVTLANREQVEKLKALLDRFGADYKEIGSTHQHPEVHTENKRRP